jgi:hypothetical protein
VYEKQQSGYATFRTNGQYDSTQWQAVWEKEGFKEGAPDAIYFYETPPGEPGGVWGYFSFFPTPGAPHQNWTPRGDDEGEAWGWTFVSQHWTVEISK